MEPAVTGGHTSPLLSVTIVSAAGSAVQQIADRTTELQKDIIARSPARADPRASQVVLYLTPSTSCHPYLCRPESIAVAAASA
jgi:hypothetical protein